ncbi:hypothetical protein EDD17DRAFT_1773326 [Pisolithus thermaeus]|nr:hypothetical protein EDD17DRAFT_1773326 [Pisolithus thermaeus]
MESSNECDLLQELELLNLQVGKYFLESFYRHAQTFNVNLPEIRWNVEGTFVGTVTVCDLPSKPTDGSEDNHTLLFKNFLAAPLLTCDGLYEEQKFAGNTDFAPNKDKLGIVIDAYIHHVVVLLSDVQGIINQSSGHWDEGMSQIKKYLNEHKCNSVCCSLMLHCSDADGIEQLDNSQSSSQQSLSHRHPLHVGF